jgi:hypothetical protein
MKARADAPVHCQPASPILRRRRFRDREMLPHSRADAYEEDLVELRREHGQVMDSRKRHRHPQRLGREAFGGAAGVASETLAFLTTPRLDLRNDTASVEDVH